MATAPAPSPSPAQSESPLQEVRGLLDQYSYVQNSMMMAGFGVVSYFGAGPALGVGHLTSMAITGGIATASAATFFHGRLQSEREQIRRRCIQSLEPILGKGLLGLSLGEWDRTWGTDPGRISIRYAVGMPDGDSQWTQAITGALAARTGLAFKVAKLDRKRCSLRLERDTSTPVVRSAQARRAETILTELVPSAEVTDIEVNELGDPIRIEIRHHAAHKLAVRGYQNRVTRTLSTSLPGRWRAKWDTINDTASFSLRPEFPSSVWVKPITIDRGSDPLKTYRQVKIPFAVSEDGETIVWRPAIDPHFLCVGPTGSGKTSTEHAILTSIAAYNWPIWVGDGKSIEFLGFRLWPNVQVVATNTMEQMAVIHRAWQVMEKRYELITKGLAREEDFVPLMVFIDEWADMRPAIAEEYSRLKERGMPSKCPVFNEYESIARKGRTARVHLLVSLQRPDVSVFGTGESRDNFRCRVAMGPMSPQGAQMMWGDPSIGVGIPTGKPGRGMAVTEDNRVVEVQCFRTPDPRKAVGDPEQMALLASLAPTEPRHPPFTIEPPVLDDLDCEEGQEPAPPGYYDLIEAPWSEVTEPLCWEDIAKDFTEEAAENARYLSDPATILGVSLDPTTRARPTHSTSYTTDPDPTEPATEAMESEPSLFEGYGPQIDLSPTHVQLGDLVLIEPENDRWAVVDQDPDDYEEDYDAIAIPWRDGDEDGLMSVPTSETVTIRRMMDQGAYV